MGIVSNLVGNRVFNAASSTANRGAVSASGAQGYLQRELAKGVQAPAAPNRNSLTGASQWGNDGESDTRSGVAANTLANNSAPASTQTPTVRPRIVAPTPRAASAVPNTAIRVTKTGALKLPFNFKYSAGILNEKKNALANLMKLRQARQQEQLEYENSLYDTNRAYEQTKVAALADNASRGTAFSSGYGKAVADNATDYNTTLGKLTAAEKLSKTNERTSANQIQQSLNDYLKMAAVQQGYVYDQDVSTGKYKFKKKKSSKKGKK